MKRIVTILLSLASFAYAGAVNYAGIQSGIDSIISNSLPAGTDISVCVWDLTADKEVYSHREDILNRPASTMKVLTSFTALSYLGADYCFKTEIRTDGRIGDDGILDGNLYIVGGLDPQLAETDLQNMVADISAAGIKGIRGDVVADITVMDSVYWGSGWVWDDTPNSFQPYISPLMVHGGYVAVSVKPGRRGDSPVVTVVPESGYYEVENRAVTGDTSKGPLTIVRDWLENSNTIIIDGNAAQAATINLNIYDSDNFTFTLFREYLDAASVGYGGYRYGRCPADASLLAVAGHSIKSVIKEALKESVNVDAEALLLQSARAYSPSETSFNRAAKFQESFLRKRVDCAGGNFSMADGSGLSVYDYVPASLFVEVLKQIYSDNEMFGIIYTSLPISGHDGTLRGRMGGAETAGRVHAKTGTVTGSCTLAGYAKTSDGHDLAFCIMNSGAVKMAGSRRVQDLICRILCE
mgnify:CR=1 FL=1